jgi:hypothetical protein
MIYIGYSPCVSVRGLRKNSAPAEIRSEYLPNTRLEHHLYISLFYWENGKKFWEELVEVEVTLRPTVSRPVSLGVRLLSATSDQSFFLLEIFFRQLRVCYFVAPYLTRGRMCNLVSLLFLVSFNTTRTPQKTNYPTVLCYRENVLTELYLAAIWQYTELLLYV